MSRATDPYSTRWQEQNAATNADQAEFSAFRNGSTVLDTGIYDERIAESMDDYEPSTESHHESFEQVDLKIDSSVGHIHEEIERRQEILGDAYPFALNGNNLSHEPIANIYYEYFLAICNSSTITTGEYVELPRSFERITAQLISANFGPFARHIHTGWPRDVSVGTSFKSAMKSVSAQTGEWIWGPEEDLPDDPVNGDCGCDFVTWIETLDRRQIGQLFLLGQCACGNNWNVKFDDLNIRNLEKWFNPLSLIEPVKLFAIPFHTVDALLRDVSRKAGIVFDRARLVMIASSVDTTEIDSKFNTQMHELIHLVANTSRSSP